MEFQSTPSVGRATWFGIRKVIKIIIFQSTPSVGRATTRQRKRKAPGNISIHALRGEGDDFDVAGTHVHLWISIHALRGEGDASRPINRF